MICTQPVSLTERPVVTLADELPLVAIHSNRGWDHFTSRQLHRIVLSAIENITLHERRLQQQKERLLTALTTISARISPQSPVEDREDFAEYVALVGVKLTKSEKKKFGIKDDKEGK
jgi:hypothetical protein